MKVYDKHISELYHSQGPLLRLKTSQVNDIDKAFANVYASFSHRATKTVPLASAVKLQVIDELSFVACTRKHLYYVRDSVPSEIPIDLDAEITSLSVPLDCAYCFVSLTNRCIVVVSLTTLSKLSQFGPFEFELQSISVFNSDMLAGYGSKLGFAFSWKDENLQLLSTVAVPSANKVAVCASFIIFMEEHSWRLTDYDTKELYAQTCEGTPEFTAISNSAQHFAVLVREGAIGVLQVFEMEPEIRPVSRITLNEVYLTDLIMLKFVQDSIDIIAGYKNGAFSVINEKRLVKKVKIAQRKTVVSYMTIDRMGEVLFTCGKENIYIVPLPKRRRVVINLEEPMFNIRNASDEEVLFLTRKTHNCTITHLKLTDVTTQVHQLPQNLNILALEYASSQNQYFLLTAEAEAVTVYAMQPDLTTLTIVYSSEHVEDPAVTILLLTDDERYLVFYDGGYLRVFSSQNFLLLSVYEPPVKLRQVHYLQELATLAFTSALGSVKLWHFRVDTFDDVRILSNRRISSMTSTLATKYLFVGTVDGKISVCNMFTMRCSLSLKCHTAPVTQLAVSENYLYSLDESSLFVCWELDTKDISYKRQLDMNKVLWSVNKKWLVHFNECCLQINKNLLQSRNVHFVGVREDFRFMKYVKKLYPGQRTPAYDPNYETAIVFPYFFRPMHFYAYFGHIDHLRQSLLNSYALTNDIFGENALSLSAQRRFTECIEVVIKHIVKNYNLSVNPYLLRAINNHTIQLVNSVRIRNLHKLYDLFSRESTNPKLPKLVSEKVKTPVFFLSGDLIPLATDFQLGALDLETGKEVKFYESLIKLKIKIGTKESKEFLLSLMNTENTEILKSPYVTMLLEHKWRILSWIMKVQALIYTIYTLLLLGHCVNLRGDNTVSPSAQLVVAFIFNMLLLVFEVLQVLQGFRIYIRDVMNQLDVVRWCLFFIYSVVYWSSASDEVQLGFRYAAMAATLLKGVTYFRVFELTRYLINLLKVVLIDSRAFAIILFYTTVSSGFLLYLGADDESSVLSEMGTAFALDLGDFETEGFNTGQWVFFVLAAIINPILMLNILIAIFNDTYVRVEASKDIANNLEIASMLYEIESFLFWTKSTRQTKYVQACTDKFTAVKTLDDRLRLMKKKMRNDTARVLQAVEEAAQKNTQQFEEIKRLILDRSD